MDKPNPFLKLMQSVKKDLPTTPKSTEKNISDSVSGALTKTSAQATPVSSVPTEKASLPEGIPSSQLLLGNPFTGLRPPEPAESNGELVPSGVQELGAIDTESMEPSEKREANLNVKAKAFGKTLTLDSASSVRALCDEIDSLIGDNATGASAALQGPNLITIRNYVQSLMVTLKSRPEFDSVLIAHDVRNVMKFIRATRQETLELRDIKVTKKAVRAAKKETSTNKAKGFDDAFKSVMFGTLPKIGGK